MKDRAPGTQLARVRNGSFSVDEGELAPVIWLHMLEVEYTPMVVTPTARRPATAPCKSERFVARSVLDQLFAVSTSSHHGAVLAALEPEAAAALLNESWAALQP